MSFITKRERVFNEYELFDLPSRNEGKIKAYASCTDARAWSHFCGDKSEHLAEIIKRNNETCKTKYVPTEAIVNALLSHKNTEITRLNRKIEEFEQMLAAYDDLDLTCEQKCEIAKAHAAIKEANKELNELWFDLDLSGFTGIDSEDFETGKSRGDEPSSKYKDVTPDETPRSKGDEWLYPPPQEPKNSQIDETEVKYTSEASTNAVDTRIEEMQESIISKDAKLNAMNNTIAVMENDVCEPYCIYAHINTALEKIYAILCQNDKYKLYLDLMTAGRDTCCLDIRGKILYKLKVLEKFNLALIAPCSQNNQRNSQQDCACFRAEIVSRVETIYALTSAETQQLSLDDKRAQLVADIMQNEEMKEILSKDSVTVNTDINFEDVAIDSYNIDQENLKRLKNLQQNYEDLMNCYEDLKHEKGCLQIRCAKYQELEKEVESLKSQLREYNTLWNEKEHYRKRSENVDSLKEQYLVLYDETSSLESNLKAESEINALKTKTIEKLRNDNLTLEKKLNETAIFFEKERSNLECKIKECECTIMCQKQQITSLSIQIDKLLERDFNKEQTSEVEVTTVEIIDEINTLRKENKNLKDILYLTEEEKQKLQEEFNNQLNLINRYKMEVEDWKSSYEEMLQRNDYLEKCSESLREEANRLVEENKDKTSAIDNLITVIDKKSHEINKLIDKVEDKNQENSKLCNELNSLRNYCNKKDEENENEIKIAKQKSQELFEKIKYYENLVNEKDNLEHLLNLQNEKFNQMKAVFKSTQNENNNLQLKVTDLESRNSHLLRDIQKLKLSNEDKVDNISSLQEEKNQYKMSLELTKKDSKILEEKLSLYGDIAQQLEQLKKSNENILKDKHKLEIELTNRLHELQNANNALNLEIDENIELKNQSKRLEDLNANLMKTNDGYKNIMKEMQQLQLELEKKKQDFNELLDNFNNLKLDYRTNIEAYEALLRDRNILKEDLEAKTIEINNLCINLETKTEENSKLANKVRLLEHNNSTVQDSIQNLEEENFSTKNSLNVLKRESIELMDKVKHCTELELKYNHLKRDHDEVVSEKDCLQKLLHEKTLEYMKIRQDNYALNSESQILLTHSEDLEQALINARKQLVQTSSSTSIKEILYEIDAMKKEKIKNQNKIRELRDKLEASENVIADLSEDILKRDDKIAIMQNHINSLQDEVRRLHITLEEVVDTGEQITENSYQKINESFQSIEAHHSKTIHNMKMEIAKLQNDNIMLEEQLSASKIENYNCIQDTQKIISQINNLQKERAIIVTDIKQLEIKSVGDSILTSEDCNIDDILMSLDRIRNCLDNYNSHSVEQTLLKVRNSYQIVQDKTDEAKKIVEKEKQKILTEKEEAIRDRFIMERQLMVLKDTLEKQTNHDKKMIKDLEAEILNQKLITDKLNQSTNKYINKLKEELQSIQELYNTSLEKISNLEKNLECISAEKNRHLGLIAMVNKDLQEKCEEIKLLQKEINSTKKVITHNASTQAIITSYKDVETQMEKVPEYENKSTKNYNYTHTENQNIYERKQDISKPINEVQILTANVEPSFDYVKNCYLNYKLQHLNYSRIEQQWISGSSDSGLENDSTVNPFSKKPTTSYDIKQDTLIDIYNKESITTSSSKILGSNITGLGLTAESFDRMNSSNIQKQPSELLGSVSAAREEKGLFVIYKDSDSNYTNQSCDKKLYNMINHTSEILIETVAIHTGKFDKYEQSKNKMNDKNVETDSTLYLEDNGSMKHKLKINLPRVGTDNFTLEPGLDIEKKSIYSLSVDSESQNNLPLPQINSCTKMKDSSKSQSQLSISNVETQCSQSLCISTEEENFIDHTTKKPKNGKKYKNYFVIKLDSDQTTNLYTEKTCPDSTIPKSNYDDSETRRGLTRVDANVRLLTEQAPKTDLLTNKSEENMNGHHGLDFILDAVEPDNIKTYSAAKRLRGSRSNDYVKNVTKTQCKTNKNPDSSQPRLNDQKYSFTEFDTLSNKSVNKSKSTTEGFIVVKTDTVKDYENKIKELSVTVKKIERDYKNKLDALKMQYDNNIKSILNEHDEGVKRIQGLHEETLQDIKRHHENEVENLRSMSIEAMRKAEKLEKENKSVKCTLQDSNLDEEPIKISTPELERRKRSRVDTKLSKTNVEAFNVKPKSRSSGPCTCSLDVNLSDTIRNIFEQVDVEQRKVAEHTYLKYIANKILSANVEALDCQELSFLHLKVCRTWKLKLTKEETLQKRIDSLEAELMNKQRHTQQNIADLDRKVAEERRRLQEVKEAVCRNVPTGSKCDDPEQGTSLPTANRDVLKPTRLASHGILPEENISDNRLDPEATELGSAGDVVPVLNTGARGKRRKSDNRAVLAKMDAEERREKKLLINDEPPTRLRRAHDRTLQRLARK